MQVVQQTQLMQQNLQRMIKNQNYFSCFLQSSRDQIQPSNPFQKKLFDKNLRRSTISCGHYNSVSTNNRMEEIQSKPVSSLRKQVDGLYENDDRGMENNKNYKLIQNNHKVHFTQSRHSNPYKSQISQVINNFRQELDYLQQKLHQKVDELNDTEYENQNQKQRQFEFMVQSLQKIVGFMIENCVNLEETFFCGDIPSQKINTHKLFNEKHHNKIKESQIYSIEEENQNRQNMSFNMQNNSVQKNQLKKKKIISVRQKQTDEKQNNIPNTYFIGGKLHKDSDINGDQTQKKSSKPYSHIKPIKSGHKSSHTAKIADQHTKGFSNHSSKDQPMTHSKASFNHAQPQQTGVQRKSIYEIVLQQRQMRIQNRKKMI